MGVIAEVRVGKQHLGASAELTGGSRLLRSGTHPLAKLLDQPFVSLPP